MQRLELSFGCAARRHWGVCQAVRKEPRHAACKNALAALPRILASAGCDLRLRGTCTTGLRCHQGDYGCGQGCLGPAQAGADILEVHLKSNPTTGYTWYVHPKSTTLLKLIGQSQTQAPQPGVGRPIFQIFRFQAVAVGDGILLLHYIRAWERPLPMEEQFELHVSIR